MAHESAHQGKQASLISSGFCYQDFSNNSNHHHHHPMQSFEPNPTELFHLEPGDHRSHTTLWRGFEEIKPGYHGSSSSSKALAADTSVEFYQPSEFHKQEFSSGGFSETLTENLMGTTETTPWQTNRVLVDDSSLRCLFPGVRNDQRNQGLSLSLCNVQQSDHDAVLQNQQPLEQRELISNHQFNLRHISTNLQQQDGRFYSSQSSPGLSQQPHSLRSSKYLAPAQDVLIEFCNLDAGAINSGGSKRNFRRSNQWEEGASSSSSSAWNQSLFSSDILELQKRKAKLLSMLEEVDRRYRRYCEQMRAVVSSFDEVAGEGAARVYSTMASKAMSRHFRYLRDGVVGQIRAVKKAMGEKDPIAPGSTRGETPRLKLLDQCLRQQKSFQQAGLIETHPWRPQRGLPERSVSVLRAWLFEHFLHPYPSDVDKHILARQTGLSRSQVSNWFINARVRLWKPMVEEMYVEETKEMPNQSSHGAPVHEVSSNRPTQNPNPNPNFSNLSPRIEDQKPVPGLLINDSDSLSSIINNHHNRERRDPNQQQFSMGSSVMDIDFSSYNDCGHEQRFGKSVSLTLGLQQHNGGGASMSSPASQHSLFFPRETMDNCQPVQFSILDGDGHNLPYRNLMGTRLLHDLPG